MAELQGAGYYLYFTEPPEGQATCSEFWEASFWAKDFWEEEFWEGNCPVSGGKKRKTKKRKEEEKEEDGLRKHRRKIIYVSKTKEVELVPDNVSDLVKQVVAEGKVVVDGTEVEVGNIPITPILQLTTAPDLEAIKDGVEREIAQLIRVQEQARFDKAVLLYKEELYRFEEMFLMLLILITES